MSNVQCILCIKDKIIISEGVSTPVNREPWENVWDWTRGNDHGLNSSVWMILVNRPVYPIYALSVVGKWLSVVFRL